MSLYETKTAPTLFSFLCWWLLFDRNQPTSPFLIQLSYSLIVTHFPHFLISPSIYLLYLLLSYTNEVCIYPYLSICSCALCLNLLSLQKYYDLVRILMRDAYWSSLKILLMLESLTVFIKYNFLQGFKFNNFQYEFFKISLNYLYLMKIF